MPSSAPPDESRRFPVVLLGLAGAISLATLAAALPVLLMVHVPVYTRVLASAVDAPRLASLPPATALAAAEDVRRVVAGASEGSLPPEVDGRPGFGEREREHLADVRDAVRLARWAAAVAALASAGWLAAASRAGGREVARGLRLAGGLLLGVTAVAALVGLTDFEAFFTRFHDAFFAPGSWVFPYDSLLVQLFPASFWAVSATLWGAASAAAALGMLTNGRRHRAEEV